MRPPAPAPAPAPTSVAGKDDKHAYGIVVGSTQGSAASSTPATATKKFPVVQVEELAEYESPDDVKPISIAPVPRREPSPPPAPAPVPVPAPAATPARTSAPAPVIPKSTAAGLSTMGYPVRDVNLESRLSAVYALNDAGCPSLPLLVPTDPDVAASFRAALQDPSARLSCSFLPACEAVNQCEESACSSRTPLTINVTGVQLQQILPALKIAAAVIKVGSDAIDSAPVSFSHRLARMHHPEVNPPLCLPFRDPCPLTLDLLSLTIDSRPGPPRGYCPPLARYAQPRTLTPY